MLYELFDYLNQHFDIPGAGVFQYISFRASMAFIFSLLISVIFGKRIINYLRQSQVGETIRELGLQGQEQKAGTPTMGGLIILAAILIPSLLFADLSNVYIMLLILSTIWLGFIGFLDDYKKLKYKNKEGLKGKYKIIGQVVLGIIVGSTMYFHPDVTIREKVTVGMHIDAEGNQTPITEMISSKELKTTIPFVKNNELDYVSVLSFMGDKAEKYGWLIFIPVVIFIITAVSNAANLTDGIDGLATGTSAIIGVTLGVFAYLSGNIIFSDFLNILYIPDVGEMVVYMAAFVGGTVGFLWYNSYPAQVFMGDTGSLALGGIIAVFAIAIRKELLIPILCGIFVAENLSVIIQVSYFKYTRKKFGEGKRVFLMSPLHHHYQKKGYHESKIVMRFFLIGVLLAVATFITLKLR